MEETKKRYCPLFKLVLLKKKKGLECGVNGEQFHVLINYWC